MRWEATTLIVAFALSALVTVSQIGKPRDPIEARTVAITLPIVALEVWLLVRLGATSS